jgi:DNA repair photolyase
MITIFGCTSRPILVPCSLDDFEYQIDPYRGCEHDCRNCCVLNQAETDGTDEVLVHKEITGQLSSKKIREVSSYEKLYK